MRSPAERTWIGWGITVPDKCAERRARHVSIDQGAYVARAGSAGAAGHSEQAGSARNVRIISRWAVAVGLGRRQRRDDEKERDRRRRRSENKY